MLLRYLLARSAKLGWEVFQFWKAVPHGQDRLSIVDMDAGLIWQRRQRGRVNVYETHQRMVGHQVASAIFAVLALAACRFRERGYMFGSGRAGFQSVKALTGAADQERQDRQWQ